MRQGNESVTSLEEKDILKFLGEVKSDADVKAVVIGELATDDAKAFAFRLVHLTLPEFISEVISYDMLISYQRKSRVSSTPYSKCWHCDGYGHFREECPDILISKEKLQRRKHPRGNDTPITHSMDRGRGRGGYTRDGRSSNYCGRGRYGDRGRGRYRGNHNHYKPTNYTSLPWLFLMMGPMRRRRTPWRILDGFRLATFNRWMIR